MLRMGAELVRDLAVTAGPGTDGLITSVHRRLLACLGAANADAAEHETQRYLRCLHLMADLAGHSSPNPTAAAVSQPPRMTSDDTDRDIGCLTELLGVHAG